jgi:riboflavin kinase/FMN adenylyltransferase
MRVIGSVDELPRGIRLALTIGMFDGLHRGHQRLLGALVRTAAEADAEPVVVTFDPHPAAVLRGNPPPLLADPAEKLARLEQLGIGTTVVQHFDREFAAQPPDEFLGRLCQGRDLTAVVMTAESAFGRDRTGIPAAIRRLGETHGFRVTEVKRVESRGAPLSSTRIRGLIADGRLGATQRLLGRRYAVVGTVVTGNRRGRDLGYPTANLAFDAPVVLPPDGIYVVQATWGGDDPLSPRESRGGVASLGIRPTFENAGERVLEVYLLDFDGDLYGQKMRVEFVRKLRDEKKFESAEALVKQMERDTMRARQVLKQLFLSSPSAAGT